MFDLKPEILTHPNIPKPLHEVNPRTLMGQDRWASIRREAYASSDFHCVACGVHKSQAQKHRWLEAHEYYDIDYLIGKVIVRSIEPLCHFCHNFIHSGRLKMILNKEKSEGEVVAILEHGFHILRQHGLQSFYFTRELAEELEAETFGVSSYKVQGGDVKWEDWRLVWEGREYKPKFKSHKEWQERWGHA